MDKLDRTTILALTVLLAAIALLLYRQAMVVRPAGANPLVLAAVQAPNPELDKRLKTAGNLLEANDLEKAEQLINDLIKQFPYDGKPYMAAGDLFMRKQAPVEAMLEHRKGIDLNPDFLDKKSPVFQGKKIKGNLGEAKTIILNGLQGSPGDKTLKEYKKTLYYMQRRIAGSCG